MKAIFYITNDLFILQVKFMFHTIEYDDKTESDILIWTTSAK